MRKRRAKLGVRAVLTGRVVQRGESLVDQRRAGGRARQPPDLGPAIQSQASDVFAVQEEIAKEISEKLRLKLTGAERQQLAKRPTENLKAFQYYMQGRSVHPTSHREDLLAAIRYYERAIEEDRNYALRLRGLS